MHLHNVNHVRQTGINTGGYNRSLAIIELQAAMDDLTSNPLVREVNTAPDGSLLVMYQQGNMPQGLRIPPIYPNRLAQVQRAITVMDRRLR